MSLFGAQWAIVVGKFSENFVARVRNVSAEDRIKFRRPWRKKIGIENFSRWNEEASWNEMTLARRRYRERSVERMEFAGSIALYIGRRTHNLRFVAAPLLESSLERKTKEREREIGKRRRAR